MKNLIKENKWISTEVDGIKCKFKIFTSPKASDCGGTDYNIKIIKLKKSSFLFVKYFSCDYSTKLYLCGSQSYDEGLLNPIYIGRNTYYNAEYIKERLPKYLLILNSRQTERMLEKEYIKKVKERTTNKI